MRRVVLFSRLPEKIMRRLRKPAKNQPDRLK
jgi:hypothetical protein